MRFFFVVVTAACFHAMAQTPGDVPENLKPPAGERFAFHVTATGDQVYTCDGSQWSLSGPEAKLFDQSGKEVGSHFAGPTWQISDNSRVVGKLVASATPDANSVPWLLLTATSHSGEGLMQHVTSIQRLHTKGGKAPSSGCDASHKGEKTRSHYSADYYFYGREQ